MYWDTSLSNCTKTLTLHFNISQKFSHFSDKIFKVKTFDFTHNPENRFHNLKKYNFNGAICSVLYYWNDYYYLNQVKTSWNKYNLQLNKDSLGLFSYSIPEETWIMPMKSILCSPAVHRKFKWNEVIKLIF